MGWDEASDKLMSVSDELLPYTVGSTGKTIDERLYDYFVFGHTGISLFRADREPAERPLFDVLQYSRDDWKKLKSGTYLAAFAPGPDLDAQWPGLRQAVAAVPADREGALA